jgi:hypothetical protein
MQSQPWVVEEHSGTRVPHNFFRPLPLFGLITMDGAVGARGFLLLEGATVQAQSGVLEKRRAFWAEFALGFVFVFAVDVDHSFDGFLLPLYPGMF